MNTLSPVWSSFGTFLLGIFATLFVQWLNAYWAKWRKIDETKLGLYMSWMPYLAEWYVAGVSPALSPPDPQAFQKKKWEILGTLQIMGSTGALISFTLFSELAEMAFNRDQSFNRDEFHEAFTNLNYHFCCEIHGEILNQSQHKPFETVRRGLSNGFQKFLSAIRARVK